MERKRKAIGGKKHQTTVYRQDITGRISDGSEQSRRNPSLNSHTNSIDLPINSSKTLHITVFSQNPENPANWPIDLNPVFNYYPKE
jgi:hypothetical protein